MFWIAAMQGVDFQETIFSEGGWIAERATEAAPRSY